VLLPGPRPVPAIHEPPLPAGGLAIAGAVMLKEIALAFWLVAGCYVVLTALAGGSRQCGAPVGRRRSLAGPVRGCDRRAVSAFATIDRWFGLDRGRRHRVTSACTSASIPGADRRRPGDRTCADLRGWCRNRTCRRLAAADPPDRDRSDRLRRRRDHRIVPHPPEGAAVPHRGHPDGARHGDSPSDRWDEVWAASGDLGIRDLAG
jgi:hypothetical protein